MDGFTIAFGAISILVGLIFCFFGWRLWNFLVWVTGFLVGFAVTYRLCDQLLTEAYGVQDWVPWTSLGIGALVGIGLGCLCVCLIKVGFFIAGAIFGVGIANVLDLIFIEYVKGYPDWAYWVILAVCVIGVGAIAVCIGKTWIIISTACSGSFGIMRGITVFLQDQYDWYHIVELVGLVVFAILGMVVQFKLFGDHKHDKYAPVAKKAPAHEGDTEMVGRV